MALSEQTVRTFLAPLAEVSALLGGDATQWTVREVGDGNLNLVFIVKGPKGGIVVKHSLPSVRMVGESWPLPLDRIFFEYEALKIQSAAVPHLVPKLYHFDRGMAAIVMELLEPHLILRKGLIGGIRYPKLAEDVATFAAGTLFATPSNLAKIGETLLPKPVAEENVGRAVFVVLFIPDNLCV